VWGRGGGSTEGVHGPVVVGAGLGSQLVSALRRDRERGRKDERLSLELFGGLPRHRLFLLLRSVLAVFILLLPLFFDFRFVVLVFHYSTDGKVLLFVIVFPFLLDFNVLLAFLFAFLFFLFLHVFAVLFIFGLNVVSILLAVLDFHLGRGQHLPQILREDKTRVIQDCQTHEPCARCVRCVRLSLWWYRGGGEDDELAAGRVLDEGDDGLELAEVARLHHAVGFVDHQKLETRAIAQERVTLRTHTG
jgi:hypothetical protein